MLGSVLSKRETTWGAAKGFNDTHLNGSDALRGGTAKVTAALRPHLSAGAKERASECLLVMAGAEEMAQFVSIRAGKKK